MEEIIEDFIKAAELAGIKISRNQIDIQKLECPHKIDDLPKGKIGIYLFYFDKNCLKIGKVGPKSPARWKHHHYKSKSSKSNLAKSILDDSEMKIYNLNDESISTWIKGNTTRTNILLDESLGIFVLNYLEAFLHCKLVPKYEGFRGQTKK